jgi:hypothetical protein
MRILETASATTNSQQVVVGHNVSDSEKPAAPDHDPREHARHVVNGAMVVLFWIAVLGLGTYFYLRTEKAQILLNVTAGNPVRVSGTIVADGRPVQNGYVHIVVNEGLNERYLASDIVPIESGKNGVFRQDALALPSNTPADPRLEVLATYTGELRAGSDQAVAVTGKASAYVNMEEPFDRSSVAWLGGLGLLLLMLLIVLFTGELTAPKARALFAATYLMTFMSLAIPIAVAVMLTSNESLVETMRSGPIGLVRATTENVRDEQWMLNIGGTVTRVPIDPSQEPDPAADPNQAAANTVPLIVGGLAVPFYILMLAMLGAGINMTRQVPKVQTIYDQKIKPRREGFLIATLSALFQYQTTVDSNEREAAAEIRKHLIDSYMYLLAAPFLAIAVYYLLQIIADDTAEPVLVLMAFATGLISDAIVSRITDFAENTIARLPGRGGGQPGEPAPPAPAADSPPHPAAAKPEADAQPAAQPVQPADAQPALAVVPAVPVGTAVDVTTAVPTASASVAATPSGPAAASTLIPPPAVVEGREEEAERLASELVAQVERKIENATEALKSVEDRAQQDPRPDEKPES